MYTVVLSDHAKDQLARRAGITGRRALSAARAEIATRLTAALRLGVVPNEDLGITVYLSDGWRAVCYPTFEGRWVIATVMPPKGVDDEDLTEVREQRGVS